MIAGEFRTRDGCLLAYEDCGAGMPVLWQHGLGADRSQPAEVFPPVDGIRRLTLECRGHGRSNLGDPSRLSIATFAADALAFLDHLGMGRVTVGGISLGAAIAMRIAALHPEKVAGLILARPAWVVGPSLSTMAPYLEISELMKNLGPVEGAARFAVSDTLAAVASVSPDNAASLQSFFTRPNPESTIALLSSIPKDSPGIDAAAITNIAAPTLILGNHHDFVHPLIYAERLQQLIPNVTLRVVTAKSTSRELYKSDIQQSLTGFLTGILVAQ
jgi:pimeloyl-ACP methyl ester carboxylesterase